MVCKEELCTWFRDLSPHKRIDFMCGMVQMCLPMELRFLGSYVEDLARKDFHQLREAEGKANSRHELSNFYESETDEKSFRTKMAVYLALLHSSNRTCSSIVFKLLESHMQRALSVISGMNEVTIHSILLVLSMAMNHPSFSFIQKKTMFDYYKIASEAADQILNETSAEPGLLILSESCEGRSCDQRLSPMCSPRAPLHSPTHLVRPIASPIPTGQPMGSPTHLLQPMASPTLMGQPVGSPSHLEQQVSPGHVPSQHIQHAQTYEKVYVSEIEVKGSEKRVPDSNVLEYHIQVTWSNGEIHKVYKTYQELVEFNTKLMQQYRPDKSHSKLVKIPVLQCTQNHRKENIDLLNVYVASFSTLPEHIRQSPLFVTFFGNDSDSIAGPERGDVVRGTGHNDSIEEETVLSGKAAVQKADASTSPRSSLKRETPSVKLLTSDDPSVIEAYSSGTGPGELVCNTMSFLNESHLNGGVGSLSPASPLNQAHMNGGVGSLSPASPAYDLILSAIPHSPSISGKTSSPPVSPCQSPGSSLESLARSPPLTPCTETGAEDSSAAKVVELLKSQGLDLSAENLDDCTLEQLTEMLPEDLEASGVPKNCIKTLLESSLREKAEAPQLSNGLIDLSAGPGGVSSMMPSYWPNPSYPVVHNYLSPASHSGPLPHLAFQLQPPSLGPMAPPPVFSTFPNYHHPLQPHQQLNHQHVGQPANQHLAMNQGQGHPGLTGVQTVHGVPAMPSSSSLPVLRSDIPVGGVNLVGNEASPSNSERSSPAQSPHLSLAAMRRKPHLQQQNIGSDSSDDGDREKRMVQQRVMPVRKGNSAPSSARLARHDRQGSLDASVNSGSFPFWPDKQASDPSVHTSGGNSGYTSDPTFTRTHKAQPAHTNFQQLQNSQKRVISMPDQRFPGHSVPIGYAQMRDKQPVMGGIMNDMGQRPYNIVMNGPTFLARSHFSQMPGARPMYAPNVMNPNMSGMNMNMNQKLMPAPANVNQQHSMNSKLFQGSPAVFAPSINPPQMRSQDKSSMLNGGEMGSPTPPANSVQSSEVCSHGHNQSNQVSHVTNSSIPGSLTVTYSNANQSTPTSQVSQASCTSCGCPGHTQAQQVTPGLPYFPHMWAPNGLIHPVNHHVPVYYPPSNMYMNGLNQDMIHHGQGMYGQSHSAAQGVPSMPVYHGNLYNVVQQTGGYNGPRRQKKQSCHNCGSSKHAAEHCPEGSMEAMSGHTMFSYKPKNDSD